jgi:RNA polymerase sigma-70 factor (ECF subfamily)
MFPEQDFQELMACVRAGNAEAARALVQRCEPELRRVVRVRLTDPRLRRVLDSADICQSVLANFFMRVVVGEFDLDRPEQLVQLLLTMVRNKVFDQARRHRAGKRNGERLDAEADLDRLAGAAPDPGRVVAGQDLLATVRQLLNDEERYLADQRGLGRRWDDLAREQGIPADTLRKKLTRALDRVADRLGLEEFTDV